MSELQKSKPLIDFIPAELRTGKRCYVNYSVVNPATGKMHRKIKKVNHVKSIAERKRYGRKIVSEINQKLYSGWNPFLEQEAPRAFSRLTEVLNLFLSIKTKELRKDSIRTYKSYINIMIEWLTDNGREEMYVINFNGGATAEFMHICVHGAQCECSQIQ